MLVLDGAPGDWVPPGFDVIPQRGDGLAERLAAAFEDVGDPAFLVGMDTPQVTPALLDAGLAALDGADAVFGAALDGGYWGIGLRRPAREAFRDVPMSEAGTALAQRTRLAALGLDRRRAAPLRDVDTIDDARAVAAAGAGRPLRRRARCDASRWSGPRDRDGRTRLPADLLYGRLLERPPPSTPSAAGRLPRARAVARRVARAAPARALARRADAADDAAARGGRAGSVLDLGCGPGRHVAALRAAGKAALGVDLSPVAVRLARRRGGAVIPGDVFGAVPHAGRWRTALLLDGNVGIGGSPAVLLRRTRELLAAAGTALVEVDPPGAPTQRTRVRIEAAGVVSEWFAWARVGLDGIGAARRAGRAWRTRTRSPPAGAGSRCCAVHDAPGPVPAGVLALSAARPAG